MDWVHKYGVICHAVMPILCHSCRASSFVIPISGLSIRILVMDNAVGPFQFTNRLRKLRLEFSLSASDIDRPTDSAGFTCRRTQDRGSENSIHSSDKLTRVVSPCMYRLRCFDAVLGGETARAGLPNSAVLQKCPGYPGISFFGGKARESITVA